MVWKKNFKKIKKEKPKKKFVYEFSEGESSFIEWNRSLEEVNHWNVENLVGLIENYNLELKNVLSSQTIPTVKENGFKWDFKKYSISESFFSYPATSLFKNVFDFLKQKVGVFGATLGITSLSKFNYYVTLRFWKVFNYTFANNDLNDNNILRVFDVMQRTTLDAYEGIIEKILILLEGIEVSPYRHHLLIEEVLELGQDFTYHWSRMLDQVIDLTLETFVFQKEYGKTSSSTYTYEEPEEENFEDFFEKTKTMVFNDEVNDAFAYFDLSKMDPPNEFKRIYRKLAKKYHPDVNPDPSAANEMKKINMFKTIIEHYYEKYDIF